jgi:hypothetical protein
MSICRMTTTAYLINAALLLLIVRQIRERRVDLRGLLVPVVLVYAVAGSYLHSIPTAGNDLVLVGGLAAVGLVLGTTSAFMHSLRIGSDGVALARAGWIAAGLWVTGIGARMAFVFASEHGAEKAIAHFSAAHSITGAGAWTAALVLMALCEVASRLVALYLRAHRLTRAHTGAEVLAGAGA